MAKRLWELFYTFAKVGVMTFGGGYAMLPILQREVVENKGWATEEELANWFAIGQCTPGVIAVNTATFAGRKVLGNIGGVVATLGVVFPSLIIISLLAGVITTFAEARVGQERLRGHPCVRVRADLQRGGEAVEEVRRRQKDAGALCGHPARVAAHRPFAGDLRAVRGGQRHCAAGRAQERR